MYCLCNGRISDIHFLHGKTATAQRRAFTSSEFDLKDKICQNITYKNRIIKKSISKRNDLKTTFQFLGTGSSVGVPVIGCHCAVCTSSSPFNKRLRPSGLFKMGTKTLLIDVGPDFREQALRYKIEHLDGLLLTHTHYDHIAGLDELRIYNHMTKSSLPCLLSAESFQDIQKRYDYIFSSSKSNIAQFDFQILEGDVGKTEFLQIPIRFCSFSQSGMKVTGFRIQDFAYICDIHAFDDSIFSHLSGVQTLILSALRPEPSPFHLSFDQAIDFAKRVGAKRTFLTHLNHSVEYEEGNALLPPEVRLGYDGLEITC